jgi:hypothetical protein
MLVRQSNLCHRILIGKRAWDTTRTAPGGLPAQYGWLSGYCELSRLIFRRQ